MAILLRIYEMAEFNRFGLTREMVIAEIVDYLTSDGVADVTALADAAGEIRQAQDIESDDETCEDKCDLSPTGDVQEYASWILRRLVEAGWLEREQQVDYTEFVILPDYAFTLLEAFRNIQEQKPREYTGQLYAAHQLLTNESNDFSPALALTQAYENVRQVYDMIMDSQNILGESLFESDFCQRHQQGWDLLFERLTAAPGEELVPELRELQDYRNYLRYGIRIHYPSGDRALLSQIKAKKSGGETTTPFYVAMAASFAQAYRLNQPRPSDTIRLALFDEAFGKMDTARTASALQFMVDSQLQVLLATPPDKAAGLLPHVDSVRTVVRKNNHAFVIEIDKAQMMKELEAA